MEQIKEKTLEQCDQMVKDLKKAERHLSLAAGLLKDADRSWEADQAESLRKRARFAIDSIEGHYDYKKAGIEDAKTLTYTGGNVSVEIKNFHLWVKEIGLQEAKAMQIQFADGRPVKKGEWTTQKYACVEYEWAIGWMVSVPDGLKSKETDYWSVKYDLEKEAMAIMKERLSALGCRWFSGKKANINMGEANAFAPLSSLKVIYDALGPIHDEVRSAVRKKIFESVKSLIEQDLATINGKIEEEGK